LLCTEDDNSCYRNVCKMSVVSFALAVVFIMRLSLKLKVKGSFLTAKRAKFGCAPSAPSFHQRAGLWVFTGLSKHFCNEEVGG